MFKKILVPTDGSKRAKDAGKQAIELGKKLDSEVHFLYVVNTSLTEKIPKEGTWIQISGLLQDEGKEALQELKDLATESGAKFKTSISKGVPYKKIKKFADDENIELIVMPTSAKKGFDKLLLGSTTDRVLKQTNCPVMVIKE